MKNQQCPKPDCMYLHELGDLEASFTKEEMHQGKHQEYEKRLHDSLIAQTAAANSSPSGKLGENNKQTSENGTQNGPEKNKEAWPSLSTSPVNKETTKASKNGNNKENGGKKTKAEKARNKKAEKNANGNGSASSNGSIASGKDSSGASSGSPTSNSGKDTGFNITKDASSNQNMETPKPTMSADEELNLISEIENDALSADLDGKADTPSLRYLIIDLLNNALEKHRTKLRLFLCCSLSSSGDSGTISESVSESGKSSPASFPDHLTNDAHTTQQDFDEQQNKANLEKTSQSLFNDNFGSALNGTEINTNCHPLTNVIDTTARFSKLGLFDDNNSFFSSSTFPPSYFKLDQPQNTQLRNVDSNSQTNSPQLPDLLTGTESDKERHDMQEKISLLKSLGEINSQISSLQSVFGSNGG